MSRRRLGRINDRRRHLLERLEDRRVLTNIVSFNFSDDQGLFDSQGFTYEGQQSQWAPAYREQASATDPHMYFGVEGEDGLGSYENNSHGILASPLIDLTSYSLASVSFEHMLNIEPEFDVAAFQVVTSDGTLHRIATSGTELPNRDSVFETATFDLTPFAGDTIRLQFAVTTDETITRSGWRIDNIVVSAQDILIVESDGEAVIDEAGTLTYTLAVSLGHRPTEQGTLAITVDDTEVRIDQTSLTFTPSNWRQPQTISLVGVDDFVADGDVTSDIVFMFDMSRSDEKFHNSTGAIIPVTTLDDDQAGVTINMSGLVVDEQGEMTQTASIVLESQPTGEVRVNVTNYDTSELSITSESSDLFPFFRGLVFTPENWNIPQEILFAGVSDNRFDGDIESVVRFWFNGEYWHLPDQIFHFTTLASDRTFDYDQVSSVINLQHADGSREQVVLTGTSFVTVPPEGVGERPARDDDDNGLDELSLLIDSLHLTGDSTLGRVTISLHETRESIGKLEELANEDAGVLEVSPHGMDPAKNSLGLFISVDIENEANTFSNIEPLPMVGMVSSTDRVPADRLVSTHGVELFDQDGVPAGINLEMAVLALLPRDFGNAPDVGPGTAMDDYETLWANNGPTHLLVDDSPRLGDRVFSEPFAEIAITQGPDGASVPFDNDGVLLADHYLIGDQGTATVRLTGARGNVRGWIDFNQDGDFSDPFERVLSADHLSIDVDHTFSFAIPDHARAGETYARFRVSEDWMGPTGEAVGGEVEDYKIEIRGMDFGDALTRDVPFWLSDPNPQYGNGFSSHVVHLDSGNTVVTAPNQDIDGLQNVGVVYVFDRVGQLVSTLSGSQAFDRVGSGGVTALESGNFVVASPEWNYNVNSNAGAVTFGNGTFGVNGKISKWNSLHGTSHYDSVGSGGVVPLDSGDYVVLTPGWNRGTDWRNLGAGAATYGNGDLGTTGVVSIENSLIGRSSSDQVGGGGAVPLEGGGYVVLSPEWGSSTGFMDLGAATFGGAGRGITGYVNQSNSLVGRLAGSRVGSGGAVALDGGSYVVISPNWGFLEPRDGAVTFGHHETGVSGTIDPVNSLIGSRGGDHLGSGGVVALEGGAYVILSPSWGGSKGAATYSSPAGISGLIDKNTSLTGSDSGDRVGSGGAVALKGGGYVVSSPRWSNDRGAATFSNSGGITGDVSRWNSLIGARPDDQVSVGGITALNDGGYLVVSPHWDNGDIVGTGAVTYVSGNGDVAGQVSESNSLVGSQDYDQVGSGGVTALQDGGFIVASPRWDHHDVSDVGAVTLVAKNQGTAGELSESNSIIGSHPADQVGSGGVTPLPGGAYLVFSPYFDIQGMVDVGAVTFVDRANANTGKVNLRHSIFGASSGRLLGAKTALEVVNEYFFITDNGELRSGKVSSGFSSRYPTGSFDDGASHVASGPQFGPSRTIESRSATESAGLVSTDVEFVDIRETGTPLTSTRDRRITKQELNGFQFPFGDSIFDEFHVHSNGFITFTESSLSNNVPLLNLTVPTIAVLWDYLDTTSIHWELQETASLPRLVVQWQAKRSRVVAAPTADFQAILYQDGSIELNYRGLDAVGVGYGSSSTIGFVHTQYHAEVFSHNHFLGTDPFSLMYDATDQVADSGDDGIVISTPILASTIDSTTASVDVDLQNADSQHNLLSAWIDFNADGDWSDLGEQILSDFDLGTTNGIQSIPFNVPAAIGARVRSGQTYARFRVSTQSGLRDGGRAQDGEVEDHLIDIRIDVPSRLDFGDAPIGYPVQTAENGASHTPTSLFLGSGVDAESDGQQSESADADGDDGIRIIADPVAVESSESTASVLVTASESGLLDAWIDFNGDLDWDDDGEQIATAIELSQGENVLAFTVPASAIGGDTYARFRLSTFGDLSPVGHADSGEVEDHVLTILDGTTLPSVSVSGIEPDITIAIVNDRLVVQEGMTLHFNTPLTSVGGLNVETGPTETNNILIDLGEGENVPAIGLALHGRGNRNTLKISGNRADLDFTHSGSISATNFQLIDVTDASNAILRFATGSIDAIAQGANLEVIGDQRDTVAFADPNEWRMGHTLVRNGRFIREVTHVSSGESFELDLPNSWQNLVNHLDTDNSGGPLTPLDALQVINILSVRRRGDVQDDRLPDPTSLVEFPVDLWVDTDGNGSLTPFDALKVINELSADASTPQGESPVNFNMHHFVAQVRDVSSQPRPNPFAMFDLSELGSPDKELPSFTPGNNDVISLWNFSTNESTAVAYTEAVDELLADVGAVLGHGV